MVSKLVLLGVNKYQAWHNTTLNWAPFHSAPVWHLHNKKLANVQHDLQPKIVCCPWKENVNKDNAHKWNTWKLNSSVAWLFWRWQLENFKIRHMARVIYLLDSRLWSPDLWLVPSGWKAIRPDIAGLTVPASFSSFRVQCQCHLFKNILPNARGPHSLPAKFQDSSYFV